MDRVQHCIFASMMPPPLGRKNQKMSSTGMCGCHSCFNDAAPIGAEEPMTADEFDNLDLIASMMPPPLGRKNPGVSVPGDSPTRPLQ